MGRIDHGGVRGRSAPLDRVDLLSRLVKEAAVVAVTTVLRKQCRQSPQAYHQTQTIFELGLTYSQTVASWHRSRLTDQCVNFFWRSH